MSMNSFMNSSRAKEFNVANHNKSDFASFNAFQQRLTQQYAKLDAEKEKEARERAVATWIAKTPPRWRDADLNTIDHNGARDVEKILKEHGPSNFFIKGESQAGKTYLAFAIARRYVELGLVNASSFVILSEEALLRLPKLGFSGQQKFEQLLNPKISLYIFDDVSSRGEYDKDAAVMWEQMIDHIYNHSTHVIFTSSGSAAGFCEKLSNTSGPKFQHLVEHGLIAINRESTPTQLNDWTETEQKAQDDKMDLATKFPKSNRRR